MPNSHPDFAFISLLISTISFREARAMVSYTQRITQQLCSPYSSIRPQFVLSLFQVRYYSLHRIAVRWFQNHRSPPYKFVVGQFQKLFERPAKYIGIITAFGQYLHQSSAMSKGIKIYRSCWCRTEMLFKIFTAQKYLAYKWFAEGILQSGCRYQPPMICQRFALTSFCIRLNNSGSNCCTHLYRITSLWLKTKFGYFSHNSAATRNVETAAEAPSSIPKAIPGLSERYK